MRAKSISDFRKNIATDVEAVVEDHEPLIVTRTGGKEAVVVVSLKEYESWKETLYLMSTPANAQELRDSIAELEAGKGVERKLIE
ncbi:type II toxin-antitoxin system Phd/YefM family antitoxin [Devosia psychrophila]|jgi:antitoxin YefM|uniref:Antitoxin n=1 Tax=Devosia psychrophila TaxID=728005 RepID=A0A0F5PYI0_9HYPH|nr:type II toxin-antitoxin system prevent-host-death family antitoxin [Devosia psychrophila]KKC33655.1 hypothetical protein WH91_07320 [Devosia psychrophila]SFC70897.1 antitoxin YefM [Devosia psychrophila]